MSARISTHRFLALSLTLFSLAGSLSKCVAGEVLVVDRLSNSVYAYSDTGTLLGTVVTDNTNLNQPDGLVVSPDLQHLYVASSQNNEVVEYDYNYANGTATNPQVIATAAQGLAFPNAMTFSPDGSKLYVANLNGTGITQAQSRMARASAGPNLFWRIEFRVPVGWPSMAARCWPADSMAGPSHNRTRPVTSMSGFEKRRSRHDPGRCRRIRQRQRSVCHRIVRTIARKVQRNDGRSGQHI